MIVAAFTAGYVACDCYFNDIVTLSTFIIPFMFAIATCIFIQKQTKRGAKTFTSFIYGFVGSIILNVTFHKILRVIPFPPKP